MSTKSLFLVGKYIQTRDLAWIALIRSQIGVGLPLLGLTESRNWWKDVEQYL